MPRTPAKLTPHLLGRNGERGAAFPQRTRTVTANPELGPKAARQAAGAAARPGSATRKEGRKEVCPPPHGPRGALRTALKADGEPGQAAAAPCFPLHLGD